MMSATIYGLGNLGTDPDLRRSGDRPVCTFRLAFGKGDEAAWVRVVVWDEDAENCARFLRRGRMVFVEGRLQVRRYRDKDGIDRELIEVVSRRITFLGPKTEGDEGAGEPEPALPPPPKRRPGAGSGRSTKDLHHSSQKGG